MCVPLNNNKFDESENVSALQKPDPVYRMRLPETQITLLDPF